LAMDDGLIVVHPCHRVTVVQGPFCCMIVRTILHEMEREMAVSPGPTGTIYQSTDLARRAREVMEAAHQPGGALIRDKDGTSFLLAPARASTIGRYLLDGLRSAVRVFFALQMPVEDRDSLYYGSLAWLAILPDDDQREFVGQYVRALEDVEVTGLHFVEQLVYEWQQTARVWADEALRSELTADLPSPLHDVEL
jgi:hypothetical protein